MPELPTGTVTFLFTDIEGSTRLLKALGERYADALSEHQQLLRAAFEQSGGQEIDTQGDAFFVAFRRAKDAVAAALAAQTALVRHPWPNGEPVRVRMGIHTAEPVVGGERYVGLGVHRAARVCSAGHGGQVLVSGATRELIEEELPPRVRLVDLGEHRLKDLDRPEHIYQLVGDGLASDFPPLKTLAAQPAEATPFAGRERELAAAAHAAVGRRLRLPSRLLLLVAGAALAAGAVAAAVLLLNGGSEGALASLPPDSVGAIDPDSGEIVDVVGVDESPGPIAFGAGALWVLNGNSRTLSHINPRTHKLLGTDGIGGLPSNMTASRRDVWVLDSCNQNVNPSLIRFGNGSLSNAEPVTLPSKGKAPEPGQTLLCGLAAAGDSVWVGLKTPSSLVRVDIDSVSGRATASAVIPIPGQSTAIAVGPRAVWVADYAANLVRRLDPETHELVGTVTVGNGPIAIAVGDDAVWVANANEDSVSRIDPRTNSVVKAISVGDAPFALAVAPGAVWVANSGDGTVSRIDSVGNEVTKTIDVGHRPQGIAVGSGFVWVTVRR